MILCDAHLDTNEVAGEREWPNTPPVLIQPAIGVTHVSAEPVAGIAFFDTKTRAIELIFAGTQWSAHASP